MNPELFKYTLMLNLLAPDSTGMSEVELISSTTSWDSNAVVLSTSKEQRRNKIFEKLFVQFNEDVDKYSSLVEGYFAEAKQYFSQSLDKISDLQPDNVIFSLTNSNSLYFRVYKGSFRAHIEVFYDYKNEDEDVELVATIYSLNNVSSNIADDFESGFIAINEVLLNSTIFPSSTYSVAELAEKEYA